MHLPVPRAPAREDLAVDVRTRILRGDRDAPRPIERRSCTRPAHKRGTMPNMAMRGIHSVRLRSRRPSSNWASGATRNEPPSRGPLQMTAIMMVCSREAPSVVMTARIGWIEERIVLSTTGTYRAIPRTRRRRRASEVTQPSNPIPTALSARQPPVQRHPPGYPGASPRGRSARAWNPPAPRTTAKSFPEPPDAAQGARRAAFACDNGPFYLVRCHRPHGHDDVKPIGHRWAASPPPRPRGVGPGQSRPQFPERRVRCAATCARHAAGARVDDALILDMTTLCVRMRDGRRVALWPTTPAQPGYWPATRSPAPRRTPARGGAR